jgi:hypothetical protein
MYCTACSTLYMASNKPHDQQTDAARLLAQVPRRAPPTFWRVGCCSASCQLPCRLRCCRWIHWRCGVKPQRLCSGAGAAADAAAEADAAAPLAVGGAAAALCSPPPGCVSSEVMQPCKVCSGESHWSAADLLALGKWGPQQKALTVLWLQARELKHPGNPLEVSHLSSSSSLSPKTSMASSSADSIARAVERRERLAGGSSSSSSKLLHTSRSTHDQTLAALTSIASISWCRPL